MRTRTAKFVSIIVTGLFASVTLTASLAATPASAADECLAAPKDQAPQGSHWRYHIEHPSNRHCWYLRKDEPQAQTAQPKSFASAKPVAPKAEAAMPGAVANARAELPSPRASLDVEKAAGAAQLPAAANAANAADTDNTTRSNPAAANMLSSVVASRWPEQLSANSPPPPTAPVSAPVSAPAEPQADEIPQAQPVSVPLAAADAPMTKKYNSALMLLIVIVGALSFAGLVASAIVRFGGKRQQGHKRVRRGHRWAGDQERSGRRRPLPFPLDAVRRPNIGLPRELQVAEDTGEGDRITQMMARLARSVQHS
jgi:hypothetical protein